jgi:hypothetical protein
MEIRKTQNLQMKMLLKIERPPGLRKRMTLLKARMKSNNNDHL